jgi:hypothetical protein
MSLAAIFEHHHNSCTTTTAIVAFSFQLDERKGVGLTLAKGAQGGVKSARMSVKFDLEAAKRARSRNREAHRRVRRA